MMNARDCKPLQNGRRQVGCGRVVTLVMAVAFIASLDVVNAAGQIIEDIRISRQGSLATAEFVFPCPVRYLSHTPRGTGASFQIRLSLDESCRVEIGTGLRSELHQPPGRDIAGIHEVAAQIRTDTPDEAMLTVSLYDATNVEVSQGATRNTIRLLIVADQRRLTQLPSTQPTPPPANNSAPVVTPPAQTELTILGREPLRLVQTAPSQSVDRFVVQLATEPASTNPADIVRPNQVDGQILYINDVTTGSRSWKELRLGFFASERAARVALDRVIGDFPAAVIAIASVEEQARAHADPLGVARVNVATASAPAASGRVPDGGGSLSAQRAAELMEQARGALFAQNYDRSIQIYTRLLEDRFYRDRGEARELLGVARERNGQLAEAKTEFEAYLTEFPDGPDAQRVRQRLAGLLSASDAAAAPTQVLRASRQTQAGGWDFSGGVSQYLRRDVIQLRDDEPEIVGRSGLHSRADLLARRQGERFDLLGRVNAGYYLDMRPEDRRPEDQALMSTAYLEITDQELDLRAIVGRQSLYKSGVLGRFDGAHVNYQWRPDIALNFTMGFPVDSPRHQTDTDRQFYSMSADFDDLLGTVDFSFFGHLQRIDGISDREAVGGEARYRDDRWNLIGTFDVDLSYEVLNSALFIANWRATDRLTLNGRLNVRSAPFLTTRNALIGQSVETIDDLLLTFSESQIRRLARDRTAQAQSASIGLSMPLSQRFQFNGDLTYTETDATVSSGGVAMVPATGPQYYYSASVVGSSLFKASDTAIFNFTHTQSLDALITSLSFDLRLPMGSRLRLNPRIGFSVRDGQRVKLDQWIASPMLRVIYRWGERHRFEAELGGEWSNRDLPSPNPLLVSVSEDSSSHFLNIGYWMEF